MNKKRTFGILFGMLAAVMLTAFATFAATTNSLVRQAGPVFTAGTSFDSTNSGQYGGEVKVYLAGDSERVGNIVYISSKNTVSKSATLANYNAIAGVVVGGVRTSMAATVALADTGTLAGILGQKVLVMSRGRAYVLADTGAGFAPGTGVIPSAKSNMGGRLTARTTAIDTFNRVFGKTVDTTVLGKAVLVNINVK